MLEETKNAQVDEPKVNKETDTPEATKVETEVKVEKTVEEVLGTSKPEPKMVPEAVLIQTKKENKELARKLKELEENRASGDITKQELSSTLDTLAEKYNVDKSFLKELSTVIRADAKEEIGDEVNSKLKPLQEQEKAKETDRLFKETYDKILEENPEYKGIVNQDVIKRLALDPTNKHKTFGKIIDEAYGHLIPGKRTMETTTPRGGKDVEVDIDKAKRDVEYFKEIMADPELKKKYNEQLISRNNF
jgi:hypothetical protein